MSYDVLGDDVEGYDVLGDMDVMGDDDVQGRPRSPRARLQRAAWAQQLRAGAPGAPAISEMLLPLGLGSVTFVQNGPTTATLTASPQLAYRGERIVLSAVAQGITFSGIDGPLAGISVSEYKVGQRSQLVSAGALPASAFGSFAFGVRTASDPCAPGIIITLGVTYIGPALGAGESVTVSGVIFGRAAG